nr:hypothetical protein [Bradyrhizobium sp. 197]
MIACLLLILALWYASEGTTAVDIVSTPRVEDFYWAAISFSQTLGTALGDWAANTGKMGYNGDADFPGCARRGDGALLFGKRIARCVVLRLHPDASALAHRWAISSTSRLAREALTGADHSHRPCLRSSSSRARFLFRSDPAVIRTIGARLVQFEDAVILKTPRLC